MCICMCICTCICICICSDLPPLLSVPFLFCGSKLVQIYNQHQPLAIAIEKTSCLWFSASFGLEASRSKPLPISMSTFGRGIEHFLVVQPMTEAAVLIPDDSNWSLLHSEAWIFLDIITHTSTFVYTTPTPCTYRHTQILVYKHHHRVIPDTFRKCWDWKGWSQCWFSEQQLVLWILKLEIGSYKCSERVNKFIVQRKYGFQ